MGLRSVSEVNGVNYFNGTTVKVIPFREVNAEVIHSD